MQLEAKYFEREGKLYFDLCDLDGNFDMAMDIAYVGGVPEIGRAHV